ncbi:lipase maturation factor 2 isoform X1 [Microcaecilia unicolor]|uniref:Lipase maturation factor n=2 Tax=Microcaecilia unicolor TaxID=1415580 RepID=A0A6P7Z6B0_9AMPH|nr:lipase maturation factor 2-like isoform X1 [Microcaecilia unicolor]
MMGEIRNPRQIFLWSMAVIYMFAFSSLYMQVPGLYGKNGILPARKVLKYTGKSLLEQLKESPTLLWLGPQLGLDTEQSMELMCLVGTVLSFGAMVMEPLRDSLVFLLLWIFYLSLYQVGQVFLYFQWDSLLLETGFLTFLVAPFHLLKWRSISRPHDGVTFWLVRWLLFRLMFASGVVKLTSRCPTWWGLTALTYHYETQCIPTPTAWFAHQLPVWFQKISVVITYIVEIGVPFLFFSPIRHLRLFAFYTQVLLQVLIIITGNYNFFNLLTIALCISLLDDEHVNFWLRRSKKKSSGSWNRTLLSFLTVLLELAVYALLIYWSVHYFGLNINWEKQLIESKPSFTYHEFIQWLKIVTLPTVWIGAASLAWEILFSMYRSACIRGILQKFWATLQWAVFSTAAVGMFTISLVPYTYIEFETNGNLWPAVHNMHNAVDKYQLVNSYGLFRRMTGVGGRPEVVVEASYDQKSWTEIEFMYKPGNLSNMSPVVAPHQPRLDWQMWFAALDHHTQSPWFTSFIYRLLQGKKEVINLVQVDESRYPFHAKPPVYIRAQLFKYWFTEVNENGELPQHWWRRQHVKEFYPTVTLGDPHLETLLSQFGLKDKGFLLRSTDAPLPFTLTFLRDCLQPYAAPSVLFSLFIAGVVICLLKALKDRTPVNAAGKQKGTRTRRADSGEPRPGSLGEKNGQTKKEEKPVNVAESLELKAKPVPEAAGDGPRIRKKKADKN